MNCLVKKVFVGLHDVLYKIPLEVENVKTINKGLLVRLENIVQTAY